MPMMRRGPLDRYPPEWVLRQANAHVASGSIEFHTERPVTFYLDGGRIYAAEEGVDLLEQDVGGRAIPEEPEARKRVIDLLSEVLAGGGGWYFHDPLGQHPGRGSWTWETTTLLTETRTRASEENSLAAWADRTVVLHDTPAASITLGADGWAIVVQLAESASATELRTRLGWNPERLLTALTEIEQRGVLDPNPSPDPAWRPRVVAPPPPPPDADHHSGPLAPPPPPSMADTRAARRRMLPTRRSGGS